MLSLLIKGIFFIITKLFDIIMTPFVAGITALFPDLSVAFNYLTSFLSMCTEYMITVCRLCLVPQRCFNYVIRFLFNIISNICYKTIYITCYNYL